MFTFTIVLHGRRCIPIGADVTFNTASRTRVQMYCVLLDPAVFTRVLPDTHNVSIWHRRNWFAMFTSPSEIARLHLQQITDKQ